MPMTLIGQPIDQRTDTLGLPLPHIDNWQEDDVPRMREAIALIDLAVHLLGLDVDGRDDAMGARAALLEWAAARPSAVQYAYDAEGRVQTITQTVGGAQRITTLTYDAEGRVATTATPVAGGAVRTETYHYDNAGRLTGSTAAEVTP